VNPRIVVQAAIMAIATGLVPANAGLIIISKVKYWKFGKIPL
jgi:hypothetical protein